LRMHRRCALRRFRHPKFEFYSKHPFSLHASQ